jgi:enoyl-CoA hydratase
MGDYRQIIYEEPAKAVARIVMNRPEKRNAQGTIMTYELDEAFKRACHDPEINVIILAGAGDHFNAGHDLSGQEALMPTAAQSRGFWGDYDAAGWAGFYSREKEMYLELTEHWRNAPKPTIAEVQGVAVAGGIMLAWACDLIICSDDARFRDNTAAELGIPGVEFFQHPFEIGVRKAKEWLFTGGWMDAAEAERRGMVNRVVPRADLSAATLALAVQIAANNPFTMRLAKEAVNKAQDLMGRKDAMDAAFSLHQIGHMQCMLTQGFPVDASRLPESVRSRMEKARAAAGETAGPDRKPTL